MYGQALRHGRKKKGLLPRELDRYPKHLAVDFRNCEASTLRRYITRYNLDCPSEASVGDMARIVAKHYNRELEVTEEDVIQKFAKYLSDYSVDPNAKRNKQGKRYGTRSAREEGSEDEGPTQPLYCICNRVSFGEMIGCDNDNCKIEWFHVGCVGIEPNTMKGKEWFCPDCRAQMEKDKKASTGEDPATKPTRSRGSKDRSKPKRKPQESLTAGQPPAKKRAEGDGASEGEGETADASRTSLTYSEMISEALESFADKRGSFKDICDVMERRHNSSLNWKPESDVRRSPVWKSSVRKILLSNAKFKKVDENIYMLT